MNRSIKLSEKHGVNPCIPRCFWCGKEKSEIALLGYLPGDKEAPMSAILDYEPCDECAAQMAKGITIMGTNDGGKTPTGSFCVVREEAIKRMMAGQDDILNEVLKRRKFYISEEEFKKSFGRPVGGEQ
jgi:hypothetical protein